jgi:hypothetical protein
MNKFFFLFIIFLILLIIIFIICKTQENFKLSKSLKEIDNNINKVINSNNNNYLIFTEQNFDKLSISERWKYRIESLKNFNNFKNDYSIKQFKYPLPKSKKNGLIFVNVASYRDAECHKTIKSLILNCSNWKNLRICVCEQNAEEDISCKYQLNPIFNSIIKVISLSYKNARGPTWARFLIQQEYNSEEYYLQIDSHTMFEKNWDEKLINSLKILPEKSCLTQYLPDYDLNNNKIVPKLRSNLIVSRICSLDCFTRINSKFIDATKKYNSPFPSNGWSACFSFSNGNICYDAPIDCYTPDVFFGEEMDICLRLFTRGWNFYSPNYPIAYTNFDRSYRETFWEKKGIGYNKDITLCSRLRIHYRLGTLPIDIKILIEDKYPGLLIEVDKFKLGNEKNLNDYEKLIGFKFNIEK